MKRKLVSILLGASMVIGAMPVYALAEEATAETETTQDWITDDGFGNLTADFPEEYPRELIKIEDDATIEAKVDALMKTLTQEEKLDMLAADGAVGTQTYGSDRPYRT